MLILLKIGSSRSNLIKICNFPRIFKEKLYFLLEFQGIFEKNIETMKNFFLRKCSTTLFLEIVEVNSNHGNRRPHDKSHCLISNGLCHIGNIIFCEE
jgi:hypothetical protein